MPSSGSRSKKARTSSSSKAPPPQPQPQRLQQIQQAQGPSPHQWQQQQLQWQQPQQQWQQPQQQQQWQQQLQPQQPQQQQFMMQPGQQQIVQHGQMTTQPAPQNPFPLAASETLPPALASTVEGGEPLESESESEAASEHDAKYSKGLDAAITRSAVAVTGLPKTRLSELVELIHEPFDSTITAEFTPATSAMLIWLLCRIKPNVKICDLRVGTYRELGTLMVKAKKRLMTSMGSSKFDDKFIIPLGCTPSSDMVMELAMENGFSEEWLTTKNAPKAKAAPGQQLSLLPFARLLPPTQPFAEPVDPGAALVAAEVLLSLIHI